MAAVRQLEFAPDLAGAPARPRHLHLVPRQPRRPSAATYRRRRMVVGVVVGGLLVVALKASAPPDAATTSVRTGAPVVHVVEPGDTYWSIATSLDADHDVREVVDALVAANGGRALQAGDRLTVPG